MPRLTQDSVQSTGAGHVKALWLAGSCKANMGANAEALALLRQSWELSREVRDETGEIENVKIEICRWLANQLYAGGMYGDAKTFLSELMRLLKRKGKAWRAYVAEAEQLSRAISDATRGIK